MLETEIEALFDRGDVTVGWGGYRGKWEFKLKRLSERWFVAVLNSLPKPYGWRVIHRRGGGPS